MKPLFKTLIPSFDEFLGKRGLRFEGVVIGGAALQLLDIITRRTKDCDVLTPVIPPEIKQASEDFATEAGLVSDWFNNGPASLLRDLPQGWQAHLRPIYQGTNLRLLTLGREDILRSKLFAYVDRGIDEEDVIKLNPSKEEINAVLDWVKDRDANPTWPEYVEMRINDLMRRLYGAD